MRQSGTNVAYERTVTLAMINAASVPLLGPMIACNHQAFPLSVIRRAEATRDRRTLCSARCSGWGTPALGNASAKGHSEACHSARITTSQRASRRRAATSSQPPMRQAADRTSPQGQMIQHAEELDI